jgi:hypothetical protein
VKGLWTSNACGVELWGVFEGLKLARACGFDKVELHVDFWAVAATLSSSKGVTATCLRLVQNIKRLLELNWEV